MKRFDFKSIPKDTKIKFLDDPAESPFIQWIPLFKAVIPELDVEHILNFHEPDFIGSRYDSGFIGSGPHVTLKPEVKQWCLENLRGNMAYPKATKVIDRNTMTTDHVYHIQFIEEHDAILFKLRWIG